MNAKRKVIFKKKDEPAVAEQEITVAAEGVRIPTFFLSRILGWFAVAVVIMGVTLFWMLSDFGGGNDMLGVAVLIAIASVINGLRTLRTAQKKDYFILRLTCVDVRPLHLFESIPAYLNPASNTAFRSGHQITLQTAGGLNIIFVYEKSRKFLVGARYDFYFRKPPGVGKLTTDTLEQLRIDHSIVDTDLTKDIKTSTGEH